MHTTSYKCDPHAGEHCIGSSGEEWITSGGRKVGSSQRLKFTRNDKLAKDEGWEEKVEMRHDHQQ